MHVSADGPSQAEHAPGPEALTSCRASSSILDGVGELSTPSVNGSTDSEKLSYQTEGAKSEVLEEIGRGGMGVVYKVHHAALDRTMAIKFLHKELAEDAVNVRRFHQEAQAAGLLSHPNLVAVYESGIASDGKPYLVMDYLDGCGLDAVIRNQGFIDIASFFHIFSQVCEGLSHAHRKGVIHRDLKPANIMVLCKEHDQRFIKIVDFGIARLLQQTAKDGVRVTQTGDVIGSPVYMSPEQCLGLAMDERSDIYSLGVVMYEALTGAPPFAGENAIQIIVKHVHEPPLSMRQLRPDLNISEEIDNLVMKALAKQPEDRWQSIDALKNEMDWIQQQSCGGRRRRFNVRQLISGQQASSWFCPSMQKALPAIVALIVIAMVALGFAVMRGGNNSVTKSLVKMNGVRDRVVSNAPPVVSSSRAAIVADREGMIQQHLSCAHQYLSVQSLREAAQEFEKASSLAAEGKNEYNVAQYRIAAGDAILSAMRGTHDSEKYAMQFYIPAQEFYAKNNIWPDQELNLLKKMESIGAPISIFERHLSLLELNHYPPAQIQCASYELGVQLRARKASEKLVEKAWLRGLQSNIKGFGHGSSFPGPLEALADTYHSQKRYAEEATLRKVSLKHYDKAIAEGETDFIGWAIEGYEKWLCSLKTLGRTAEYMQVEARYKELLRIAKDNNYSYKHRANTPPHLSL